MGGARLSLERLSFDVGLSTKTISRVLSRDMLVDLRTLEQLFASMDIILSDDDYVRAENAEDPTNVFPQPRSAFFGRREQLGRLRMLLVEKRSVTLAGTGGVGKTR